MTLTMRFVAVTVVLGCIALLVISETAAIVLRYDMSLPTTPQTITGADILDNAPIANLAIAEAWSKAFGALAEMQPDAPQRVRFPGLDIEGDIIVAPHAEQKHGADARRAISLVMSAGHGSWWRCDDGLGGKFIGIAKVPGPRDLWAIVIVGMRSRQVITAFICDHATVMTALERDRCKNPFKYGFAG